MALPTHAIFFLIGSGGNGKSVFLEVISSLCGKDNVCNISLNKLNDEKYLPELFVKMTNISSEKPTRKSFNNDLIKAVVAGDWVTGREVFKGPKKFKPYVKHCLGMNKLPEIDDDSDGMWRRIYVIEFPRRFSRHEMDVGLTGKLMLEFSGIFNWALEGYVQLKSKAFNFSVSAKMQVNKELYKRSNNSAMDFAEYHLEKTGKVKDSVRFKDVYQRYQEFCASEGAKRVFSKKEFRKYLESEQYHIENSKKHNNQVRIFGASIKTLN